MKKQLQRLKSYVSSIPISNALVKKLCKGIDFSKQSVIVEFGAGNGAVTKHILGQLNMSSRVIVVEENEERFEKLNKMKDPRLNVVQGKAKNIKKILKEFSHNKIDYVIAGSIDLKDKKIVKSSKKHLAKDGKLITYQANANIKKHLNRHFPVVNKELGLFNIPPLHLFEALMEDTKPL